MTLRHKQGLYDNLQLWEVASHSASHISHCLQAGINNLPLLSVRLNHLPCSIISSYTSKGFFVILPRNSRDCMLQLILLHKFQMCFHEKAVRSRWSFMHPLRASPCQTSGSVLFSWKALWICQLVVHAFLLHKFFMASIFHYALVVNIQNPVCILYC